MIYCHTQNDFVFLVHLQISLICLKKWVFLVINYEFIRFQYYLFVNIQSRNYYFQYHYKLILERAAMLVRHFHNLKNYWMTFYFINN